MALNSFAPEYFLQELTPLEMFEFPWVALAGALSLAGPGKQNCPGLTWKAAWFRPATTTMRTWPTARCPTWFTQSP